MLRKTLALIFSLFTISAVVNVAGKWSTFETGSPEQAGAVIAVLVLFAISFRLWSRSSRRPPRD